MTHGKLKGINIGIPRSQMSEEQLEILRKYDREYRAKRRLDPVLKERDRQAYHKCIEKNKKKVYKRNAEWRRKNWDKVYKQRKKSGYCNSSRKKWYHNRGKYNINRVISERIRHRIRNVLKGNCKSKNTLDLLGCSIEYLKLHLEFKFYGEMSWENYGSYWHIDHIRPCSSFDLSQKEEQEICFHYSNLQPLTAKENLKKGSKIIF